MLDICNTYGYTSVMARRNTYLIARISPEKKEAYECLAKREGVSLGALIRRLLEAYAYVRKKAT